jgi:hypothetical protein
MKKRKRAFGGGRKPLGEFKGKTTTLTTRITPQTKAALERRAKQHGRSLSQEIEACLNEVIHGDHWLEMFRAISSDKSDNLSQVIGG